MRGKWGEGVSNEGSKGNKGRFEAVKVFRGQSEVREGNARPMSQTATSSRAEMDCTSVDTRQAAAPKSPPIPRAVRTVDVPWGLLDWCLAPVGRVPHGSCHTSYPSSGPSVLPPGHPSLPFSMPSSGTGCPLLCPSSLSSQPRHTATLAQDQHPHRTGRPSAEEISCLTEHSV
jgi:hypothetical protein